MSPQQSTNSSGVIDVIARPPADQLTSSPNEAAPASKKPASKPEVKTAKTPKDINANVALAIIATVIIMLGLGALTVFAYLKQTGSL